MKRQSRKYGKHSFFLSFLKENVLWLKSGIILIIAMVYVFHWSSLPPRLPENAEVITIDDLQSEDLSSVPSEAEIVIVDAQDDLQIIEDMIKEQNIEDVDAAELPDIQQVLHTSRLRRLPMAITYEERLPQNVIPHKKKAEKVFKENGQDAKIAIVIDDMGGSPMRTRQITALKGPLTSSFLTFAANLQTQIKQSKDAGHEIMIHVPMQPQSDIYVSKDVLKVDMTEDEIGQTFSKMLDKFEGVKGVNNHMGSRFTESGEKLAPVMRLLAEKKLFFLDSKTTAKSKAEQVAGQYNVPYLHRHVFLDNNNDFDYIMKQLALTERIARKNGFAIAIGHPKSQTAEALRVWLGTLKDKKIRLVPLSELVSAS